MERLLHAAREQLYNLQRDLERRLETKGLSRSDAFDKAGKFVSLLQGPAFEEWLRQACEQNPKLGSRVHYMRERHQALRLLKRLAQQEMRLPTQHERQSWTV